MKSGSARAENNRGEDLAEWKNRATFVPGKMAEWSIAAVLKTVELQGSGGSNPSLSAVSIDYQSITEKAHSFTHTNVKTVRFLIGYFANNQLKSANPIVIIPSF